MFSLSLPIAASLAPLALGAAALPQAAPHQVLFDRSDALAALGNVAGSHLSGRVSFLMQQTGIAGGPIAARCNVDPARADQRDPELARHPRATMCRFSQAGRWLPVRLMLRWSGVPGSEGKEAAIAQGELIYDGMRVAVDPFPARAPAATGDIGANRYLLSINSAPAASVTIGERASVQIGQASDASARRAIMLAASAMAVLAPPSD